MATYYKILLFYIFRFFAAVCANLTEPPHSGIIVNKCCAKDEIVIEEHCQNHLDLNYDLWTPTFTDNDGLKMDSPSYSLVCGFPDCRTKRKLVIYKYPESGDRFVLLLDGKMRHFVSKDIDDQEMINEEDTRHYDYETGQYCVDKIVLNKTNTTSIEFAIICLPDIHLRSGYVFFVRRVLNPVCHAFSICCYLAMSIIYFVLPQLRDLVGNMITTIAVCLLLSQIADIILIFRELNSEFSLLMSDFVVYLGIMGAFAWLNSLGYYIWKSFRSRNVFIRVTDGRKYCYYSLYAWTSTFVMGSMALFAHIFLDTNNNLYDYMHLQRALGWLGISVFFISIAVIIIVNVFFCLSTMEVMRRISTYGQIHYKLKYHFRIFVRFLIIMTTNWFIFILTWLPFEEVFYIHIFMNTLQAVLMVYVSVINLKRVRALLQKACCYEKCVFQCCRPDDNAPDPSEWGDEMTAMNTNAY